MLMIYNKWNLVNISKLADCIKDVLKEKKKKKYITIINNYKCSKFKFKINIIIIS